MGFADVMGYYGGMPPSGIVLPNPGWETGDAGGWTLSQSGYVGCSVNDVYPRSGTYDLSIGSPSVHSGSGWARWDYPLFRELIGETVEYSLWYARRSGLGGGVEKYIAISDGLTNTKANLTNNTTTYVQLTVQHTIDSNANKLRFMIYARKTYYSMGWYFDDMQAKIL